MLFRARCTEEYEEVRIASRHHCLAGSQWGRATAFTALGGSAFYMGSSADSAFQAQPAAWNAVRRIG